MIHSRVRAPRCVLDSFPRRFVDEQGTTRRGGVVRPKIPVVWSVYGPHFTYNFMWQTTQYTECLLVADTHLQHQFTRRGVELGHASCQPMI